MMLTRDEALAFCERAVQQAGGDAEVAIRLERGALLRLANNQPTEHVSSEVPEVLVRLRDGARLGEAQGSRLDEQGVAQLIERARQQMSVLPEDPEPLPSVGPQPLLHVTAHHADSTPDTFPADARAAAGEALVAPSRAAGLRAAGICAVTERLLAKATTNGMRGCHRSTSVRLDVTAQTDDSTGWRAAWSRSLRTIDAAAMGREAAEDALASRSPQPLEPGTYRVVLGPAAVMTVLGWVAGGFNGRAVQEGRSAYAGRMGQPIFGPNVDIVQDICHPELQNCPFDGDGVALRRVELVRDGVAANVLHDRRTGAAAGLPPTGYGVGGLGTSGAFYSAAILRGDGVSHEDLLAACGDGIYINRLWYTNWVDPREGVITGMTRDGTWRIRDGRLAEPLTNARINQNLFDLLQHIEALGQPVADQDLVAPALVASRFTVSSATSF